MKRTFIGLVAAGVATMFAMGASAAVSVNLVASGAFTQGSVLTLDTFVTADAGETDNTVFGSILYPGALVNGPLDPGPAGTQSQNLLPGAGWSVMHLTGRQRSIKVLNSTIRRIGAPSPAKSHA